MWDNRGSRRLRRGPKALPEGISSCSGSFLEENFSSSFDHHLHLLLNDFHHDLAKSQPCRHSSNLSNWNRLKLVSTSQSSSLACILNIPDQKPIPSKPGEQPDKWTPCEPVVVQIKPASNYGPPRAYQASYIPMITSNVVVYQQFQMGGDYYLSPAKALRLWENDWSRIVSHNKTGPSVTVRGLMGGKTTEAVTHPEMAKNDLSSATRERCITWFTSATE